jgi:catechol 2,3-dioxygenase-like lactoylglutathione lyase family enzyme
MRLRRLQHVSSPFAEGEKAALRAFYGKLLGLREIPTPATLAHLDLVWFSVGDGLELHFFSGETARSARRHFCLDIEDLEETRRLLEAAGHEPYDDTPIPNRPRFFCRDPAGNLIEFTRVEGSYLGKST